MQKFGCWSLCACRLVSVERAVRVLILFFADESLNDTFRIEGVVAADGTRVRATASQTSVASTVRMPVTARRPSYLNFDKAAYAWKANVDYRAHPNRYRVGRGEQGVLICEPYKSELTPHWRFKTPAVAKRSARKILRLFKAYLDGEEFVGADMARKFLQMGYTRARRYANYKGGRKYDKAADYKALERGTGDPEKAVSAAIFREAWRKAEAEPRYTAQKKEWKERLG